MIVAATLMAMLVQYLSAKTGIATGKNLPELCREQFKRPVTVGLWLQAEAIAIATDLLTRHADVMGALVNRTPTTVVASVVAALIIALNAFLLWETFLG